MPGLLRLLEAFVRTAGLPRLQPHDTRGMLGRVPPGESTPSGR